MLWPLYDIVPFYVPIEFLMVTHIARLQLAFKTRKSFMTSVGNETVVVYLTDSCLNLYRTISVQICSGGNYSIQVYWFDYRPPG